MDTDSKFEEGRILGRAEERQKFEAYFHDTLAPDLMAVAFSIESIHARLEVEGHPIELELKQIEIRISEILTQVRETILSDHRSPQ
jgi:signal transduction histidine kinase